MGRDLRPRSEFVGTYPGFNRDACVGAFNWYDPADDKPGLDSGAEAELLHVILESLNALVHYATVPFWRIDTNLASFSMMTRSSSSNFFVWGFSLP